MGTAAERKGTTARQRTDPEHGSVGAREPTSAQDRAIDDIAGFRDEAESYAILYEIDQMVGPDRALTRHSPDGRPVPVSETLSGKVRQSKRVVEFAKGEKTGIGGDLCAMELQLQAGIEGDAKSGLVCFTRRPVHVWLRSHELSLWSVEQNRVRASLRNVPIWGMRVQEITEIQSEFARTQTEAMQAQMREYGSVMQSAMDTAKGLAQTAAEAVKDATQSVADAATQAKDRVTGAATDAKDKSTRK